MIKPEKSFNQDGTESTEMLLAKLEKVSAPGDFNSKVRARIAATRETSIPNFWSRYRVHISTAALTLVIASTVFISLRKEASDVAVTTKDSPKQASDDRAALNQGTESTASTTPTNPPEGRPNRSTVQEEALRSAPVTSAADSGVARPQFGTRPESSETLGVAEFFSNAGVECVFENGLWTVKSLKRDSAAGKAGIKVGDGIQAVEGMILAKDTRIVTGQDLRIMLVKRPGEEKLLSVKIGK